MKTKTAYRWKSNPLEKQIFDAWERFNRDSNITQYMLSDEINRRTHVDEETEVAVATMLQWLGSPVGQSFLEEALDIPDLREQLQKRSGE